MTKDMTHARCAEPVLLWGQPGEPDADTHMQAVNAHHAEVLETLFWCGLSARRSGSRQSFCGQAA